MVKIVEMANWDNLEQINGKREERHACIEGVNQSKKGVNVTRMAGKNKG
jgi:hypothetical protein